MVRQYSQSRTHQERVVVLLKCRMVILFFLIFMITCITVAEIPVNSLQITWERLVQFYRFFFFDRAFTASIFTNKMDY